MLVLDIMLKDVDCKASRDPCQFDIYYCDALELLLESSMTVNNDYKDTMILNTII